MAAFKDEFQNEAGSAFATDSLDYKEHLNTSTPDPEDDDLIDDDDNLDTDLDDDDTALSDDLDDDDFDDTDIAEDEDEDDDDI